MSVTLRNIVAVARREYLWRGRTRTFVLTTLFLVVVAAGVALAPVVVRYLSEYGPTDRIGVHVGDANPSVDVAAALDRLLNATASTTADGRMQKAFDVVASPDLAAARADVEAGRMKAVLALEREPDGDLGFTLYAKGLAFERMPQLIRQAATSLVVQDRLNRAGIAAGDQARLFAPATFAFRPPVEKPAGSDVAGPDSSESFVGVFILGFALQLFIFMAIMLYGQWVAMSVVEEKSSRVMEIVLGAATPFQLLAGKVLGVGALGLTQYAVVFVPASLAVVFQDRIAALVLGGTASVQLPTGLTVPMLLAFGLMFVLGFALYAVLYAGVASLVSRQEDVNLVVGPLTLLSTAGYMVAVYAGTGLVDMTSAPVVILSYVPFFAPYLMLQRLALGQVAAPEMVIAVAILVATTLGALWIAGRLYAAGVLMYGQKPSLRLVLRVFRPT